jgi:glycyl-tRNA synthetase (class II)
MSDVKLEDIVSLCKRRGFIYQGSEIYGGLAGTWDYGPLGVALKRNIMQLWWKMFVADRDDMLGVDAAILMNQKVWQASGHTETFTDPLMPCVNCGDRFRTDKLIEKHASIADYRKAIGAAYETMKDLENLGELPPEEGEGSNELFRFYTIDRRANEDFTKVYNINIEPGEDTKSVFQKTAKAIVKDLENAKTFIGFFPLYYLRSDKCPTCGNGTLRYSRSFNF